METRTIAVDFGKVDIYSKIEAGLAGLEIGVLGKRTPCSFVLLFCLSARLLKRQSRLTAQFFIESKKKKNLGWRAPGRTEPGTV